ncbi:DnaJ C-terminal domain-containing protein [Arenibaculum pallidiluteum]|uniref:DnaJ C-terminal domain-containing protein n=1 Tax=Arenibaculum pallidiluteum TaxID=2812559 RepID=UPI001A9709B0|nr:DnaJ C-terminal domain-containing protein [Arenibaculum pallidiluteum]
MASPRDPYLVLGLSRTASAEEIKAAYRRLAKQYHPDMNPGRADIEQRFKEISSAYNLLSDPDKRARYDRGEIDAQGNERGGFGRSYGSAGGSRSGGFSFDDDDFLDGLFGRRKTSGAGASGFGSKPRGADINYSVTVPFVEAALGTKRRINLSTGRSLDVNIPPGTSDQQKLRLKGQGTEGAGGAGDAIIEVHVEPHPFFTRKDLDVHLEIPVSLPEAVLGASIKVPTLDGQVAVKVPRGANTGTLLRLKGKGIRNAKGDLQGDQYVKLKVVLPDPPDADLTKFLESWAKDRSYDVRKKVFG